MPRTREQIEAAQDAWWDEDAERLNAMCGEAWREGLVPDDEEDLTPPKLNPNGSLADTPAPPTSNAEEREAVFNAQIGPLTDEFNLTPEQVEVLHAKFLRGE